MNTKLFGAALILYLAALNVPYIHLGSIFDYDDILREPAAAVLTKFADGGNELILTWFVFGLGALAFIPLAGAFRRLLATPETPWVGDATLSGVGSAIAQGVGLMRWAFVIPGLAQTYINPASSPVAREAALVAYQAVHQYGGVVIGELVGQLLLAYWTLGISRAILATRILPSWLGFAGLSTVVLWIAAQLELLATVIPMQVPEIVPFAFILWQLWLIAIAVTLIARPLTPPVKPVLPSRP